MKLANRSQVSNQSKMHISNISKDGEIANIIANFKGNEKVNGITNMIPNGKDNQCHV